MNFGPITNKCLYKSPVCTLFFLIPVGIRELIFGPLWTLSKNTEELQINLFISIFKEGILIKIIDNNKILSPIFRSLNCDVNGSIGLFTALVPIKHAMINHDNSKLFRFEKLDELKSFQYQFEHINTLEYFIDYSFFTELIEKNKLFFELKGKAQTFAAINHKCKVILEDKSLSTVYEIFYPEGLNDFLREIDHDRIIVSHGKLISIHYQKSFGRFTLSLRECSTGPKTILSYVNGHNTIEGGTHVNALKKSINKLSKKIMYLDSNSYNGKKYLCRDSPHIQLC